MLLSHWLRIFGGNMKKKNLSYLIILTLLICSMTACGKSVGSSVSPSETAETIDTAQKADSNEEITENSDKENDMAAEKEPEETTDTEETADTKEADETSPADDQNGQDNTDSDNAKAEEQPQTDPNKPVIVWIGDSLTQGSLGEDNRNENNPQAPWKVLRDICGLNVAGVGFYGFTAHDIFWAYSEYHGIKDPDIIYIYWVGSNDFFQSPDNVAQVIEETDRFNESVGITRFLMLGTTDRQDMHPETCPKVNRVLEDTYGDKYLDILPYVEYGPDGVHLTEKSYADVARAVYDKLKSLGYI